MFYINKCFTHRSVLHKHIFIQNARFKENLMFMANVNL